MSAVGHFICRYPVHFEYMYMVYFAFMSVTLLVTLSLTVGHSVPCTCTCAHVQEGKFEVMAFSSLHFNFAFIGRRTDTKAKLK